MTERGRPLVVIVGAGFGGLWAVRHLAKAPADVLLIDRHNYHTFYPLLYQVGAAELEPEQIAYPVRLILRKIRNARFAMEEVTGIDLERRALRCSGHSISYDYLILATGSAPHYFGIPGAEENALPLRSLEQGVDVRNHILSCFERATNEPDPERRRRLLTFVVVGGGPTGVEFTGALAELVYGPVRKDFPSLDFGEVRAVLLEAMDSLLAGMPQKLASYAQERLEKKGAVIRLNGAASEITPEAVYLKDGDVIPTETVIWTAGVKASDIAQQSGLPATRRGQASVTPTLQVPGHPEVFIVGDMAAVEQEGKPLPMIAPVAMQQGEAAAKNIIRMLKGQEPEPFHYGDKGMLAVVGRNAAVADLGRLEFTGFLAWLLWLGVHIYRLIGFRNRLQVLINWASAYIFFERAVRLILPSGVRLSQLNRQPASQDGARREERQYASESSHRGGG